MIQHSKEETEERQCRRPLFGFMVNEFWRISRYRDILKTREKIGKAQKFKKIDPLV